MRSIAIIGVIIIIISVVFYLSREKPCYQDESCTLKAFHEIAFGTDSREQSNEDVIRKWDEPIYIRMVVSEEHRKDELTAYVSSLTKTLEAEVNLPVKIAKTSDVANILVIFSDDFDRDIYGDLYSPLFNLYGDLFFSRYENFKEIGAQCAGMFDGRKNIEIATVLIPTIFSKGFINKCIQEEITQSMGLARDYIGFKESLFNESKGYKLTKLDLLLLRILYHPKIKSGMTFEEVKPIFSEIYNQVK